jgi:redox-sensitive bicupin YhaK (pirin superfamily)
MGNVKGIPPGDVQRMSAGTGVVHSEFNHAPDQETHFLQIWIEPLHMNVEPGYEQKSIPLNAKKGCLRLIASHDGAQDSVKMNADAQIFAGLFDGDESARLELNPARKAYVHLVQGKLEVQGQQLEAGDALMMEGKIEESVPCHAPTIVTSGYDAS